MIFFVEKHALYLAWVIALSGFCLSIYYGEILQIEPCALCWYQRIALFPLVLILGIAAYRNDLKIIPYAIPLALLGVFFALYQILRFYIPLLKGATLCSLTEDCSNPFFLKLSFLSLIGFFFIALLLFWGRNVEKKEKNH